MLFAGQEARTHPASAPPLIASLSCGSPDRLLSSLFPFRLSLSDRSADHSRLLSCLSFREARIGADSVEFAQMLPPLLLPAVGRLSLWKAVEPW